MSFPRYFKETELDAYINENVKDREAAIQGACDIIAEKVSDDVDVRNKILDSMTNLVVLLQVKRKVMKMIIKSIRCIMTIQKE